MEDDQRQLEPLRPRPEQTADRARRGEDEQRTSRRRRRSKGPVGTPIQGRRVGPRSSSWDHLHVAEAWLTMHPSSNKKMMRPPTRGEVPLGKKQKEDAGDVSRARARRVADGSNRSSLSHAVTGGTRQAGALARRLQLVDSLGPEFVQQVPTQGAECELSSCHRFRPVL